MAASFSDFDINEKIIKGLFDQNFFKPTKVQQKTIPLCLSNKDVIIQAKTGSGKTLSYLVPLLNNISTEKSDERGVVSVILVPTSELAYQIANVLHGLRKYSHAGAIKYTLLTGGRNKSGKNLEMKRCNLANVLIATPGRLLELAINHIDFSNLQYLILDEADYLLEKTFIDDVKDLLNYFPKTRVTWLFSATQNFDLINLEKLSLKDPIKVGLVDTSNTYITPVKLVHSYYQVPLQNKVESLWNLLEKKQTYKIIVFMSTQKEVLFIYRLFKALKPPYSLFHLRSNMKLDKRMVSLEKFLESKEGAVMIATDVASRGLDIKGVNLVVQYDIPREIDYYVHRAGRTCRYDNSGTSVLMVLPSERDILSVLAERGIELRQLKAHLYDPQSKEIAEKASTLYVHDQELYKIAKSAILRFIEEYKKRPPIVSGEEKECKIFDFDKLPILEYCKSIGFSRIPEIGTELTIDKADIDIGTDFFSFLVPCNNTNFEFASDSDDDEENDQVTHNNESQFEVQPAFNLEEEKEFMKREYQKVISVKKEYYEKKFNFKNKSADPNENSETSVRKIKKVKSKNFNNEENCDNNSSVESPMKVSKIQKANKMLNNKKRKRSQDGEFEGSTKKKSKKSIKDDK